MPGVHFVVGGLRLKVSFILFGIWVFVLKLQTGYGLH